MRLSALPLGFLFVLTLSAACVGNTEEGGDPPDFSAPPTGGGKADEGPITVNWPYTTREDRGGEGCGIYTFCDPGDSCADYDRAICLWTEEGVDPGELQFTWARDYNRGVGCGFYYDSTVGGTVFLFCNGNEACVGDYTCVARNP